MSDVVKWIELLLLTEDAYDEVLNSKLFEAIKYLPKVGSSDYPIYARLVCAILFKYIFGFFIYHFKFSFGDEQRYKPKRQQDLEQHILKILHTDAKALISEVCLGSLFGKGWQTFYRIRSAQYSITFNPVRLYRRFIAYVWFNVFAFMEQILMRVIKKSPGAGMAFEVLGLFDKYTPEEFNELTKYLNRYSHDEWEVLFTVRLMARPGVISREQYDKLTEQVLGLEFTRQDVRGQVLAELAKFSNEALKTLINDESHVAFLVEQLLVSAHSNPLSMNQLIVSVPFDPFYSGHVDSILEKLGRIEKSCIEVLLQAAAEEHHYSSAFLIAAHISELTIGARELLKSHINSPSARIRYLAARALMQTYRTIPVERTKLFNAILEIAIVPRHVEVTNDALTRDPLQKTFLLFLLDLAQGSPALILSLFIALRGTWKLEIVFAIRKSFETTQVSNDVIDEIAECLMDGNVAISQQLTDYLPSEIYESARWSTYGMLDQLTLLSNHICNLETPHFQVVAALMALINSKRNRPQSILSSRYSYDSFLNANQNLSFAISILEKLDEEYTLIFLTDLTDGSDFQVREQVMRTLRFFPRANPAIMSLIRTGLGDPEPKVRRVAQESLYHLPYLDNDGVKLIIETIVSHNFGGTMSEALVEDSQPIDPSAIPSVIELLRNSNEIADSEVHECWLVRYCLNVLEKTPHEVKNLIELYKQKLLAHYSYDDLRRGLRPYLILALGRVRPVASETLHMLRDFMKPGIGRMFISQIRDFDFYEMKTAAAIALDEIGSDLSNDLNWETRESIASHLTLAVKQFTSYDGSTIGKGIFSDDAIYRSAKDMTDVVKRHRCRELAVLNGIPPSQ